MLLAALDGFYFNFCNSLKISTDYEYNFECGLLKSKQELQLSLKVSNFKGCCNIEIALIQIKWCYRLSDIGFSPIFVPIGFFLSVPQGEGQGVLLGQNPLPPPPVSAPVGFLRFSSSFYNFYTLNVDIKCYKIYIDKKSLVAFMHSCVRSCTIVYFFFKYENLYFFP